MPALSNLRHERFCRMWIKTGVAAQAYRKAGYVASTRASLDACASRLLGHAKVKRRITELKKQMASRNRITVDSLLEELATDRDAARRLDQPGVAISATMHAAKLVGLLVDRKEQGAPGDFSGTTSEADVVAKVRAELGDDAAQALSLALRQVDQVSQVDEVDALPVEATHEGSSTPN